MNYIQELKKIFSQGDRYKAHRDTAPVLLEMAKDRKFLFEVIKKNLRDSKFISRNRHHPTIDFPIMEDENFSMTTNCFPSLPNKATNISHQCVHHHGKLLLSTVSVFGPGYDSIIFKKRFEINKQTKEAKLEIDNIFHHGQYHLEFIDSFTPHIVFFPSSVSITYAIWTMEKKQTSDTIKGMPLLQKFKKPIIALIKTLGMSSAFNLNLPEYLDFYVEKGKFMVKEERDFQYGGGTNDNFIQNVCYIMQEVGFDDNNFLLELKKYFTEQNNYKAIGWINALINKQKIEPLYEPTHLNIDKVNLKKEEILAAAGMRT